MYTEWGREPQPSFVRMFSQLAQGLGGGWVGKSAHKTVAGVKRSGLGLLKHLKDSNIKSVQDNFWGYGGRLNCCHKLEFSGFILKWFSTHWEQDDRRVCWYMNQTPTHKCHTLLARRLIKKLNNYRRLGILRLNFTRMSKVHCMHHYNSQQNAVYI